MATINQVRSSISGLIRSKILMSGPITVAEYMRAALTSQTLSHDREGSYSDVKGYYMKKDVFGQKGDFITSPEISQMFGELVAVWGLQTQIQVGGPKKFNIVELGPGRGTLSRDILRVFKQFGRLTGNEVALHLVEISPYLATVQAQTLCSDCTRTSQSSTEVTKTLKQESSERIDPFRDEGNGTYYHHAVAAESGFPVYWYRDLKDVPREFNFLVAHEFLDALPIHKLQRVDKSWREVLVDVVPTQDDSFRFVISRHETPAIKALRNMYPSVLEDNRGHLEISLDSLAIMEELQSRLNENGGVSLIIDYGHEGTKEDTFRGFYKHELHDALTMPGTADLTADVDFSTLKKLHQDNLLILGPVTQRSYLQHLGIEYRLKALLQKCPSADSKEATDLRTGYDMIMNDMGSRFQVMGLLPKVLENYTGTVSTIAGFSSQNENF